MYSDKMINQIYYEKLNSLNARYRIQRDLKYAVSEFATRKLNNTTRTNNTTLAIDLVPHYNHISVWYVEPLLVGEWKLIRIGITSLKPMDMLLNFPGIHRISPGSKDVYYFMRQTKNDIRDREPSNPFIFIKVIWIWLICQ